MTNENQVVESKAIGQDFVISRVFNAPRDLVWKVWTHSLHLQLWFGPKGFTTPKCTLDFRTGGIFHYCMKSLDGHEMWGKWEFIEIVPPEKLVLIASFSDAQGRTTCHPLNPAWPLKTLSTMTLTERDGQTTLKLCKIPYQATVSERQAFDSNHGSLTQGWTGTFDRLEAYLAVNK